MAFEVTATRRRPQQFDSLAGQEFVVSTLKNAIAQGRIAHAYLFSGPRGVGKTTSARLLAKALNCVHGPTDHPCGECENCRGIARGNSLDVIEIDGASNTGVNDIRVIKEEVMFPPTSSKYKIYIIDEVHMLSQSAFNALLKTIEEPPEYVIFIFATTETQKVPATIRSRCQQFNFQLIGIDTIKKLLREACDEMSLDAEEEALFWIAKEATGSMRDAYTLFDQVVSFSDGKITLDKIRDKLGLAGLDGINSVMLDVLSQNGSNAVSKVQDLLSRGISCDQLIKDFTDYFRSILLIKQGVVNQNVLGHMVSAFPKEVTDAYNSEQLEAALDLFLNLYRNIRYSINPRFELELAVSKLMHLKNVASNATVMEQLSKLKKDLLSGSVEIKKTEVKPIEVKPVEEKTVITELNMQTLKDVLPSGVKNVSKTEHGLVLEFDSKFYYEFALKDIVRIKEKIQSLAGNINVVASFSAPVTDTVVPVPVEEKPVEPEVVKPQKPEESEEDDQHKFFVDDLMLAFKGHEEK